MKVVSSFDISVVRSQLESYARSATGETGGRVRVELVEAGTAIPCPQRSQLQRMFAFGLPYVAGGDLLVTSDADAFVAAGDIVDVLREDYAVWIFQYAHTVVKRSAFLQCFVAMRADLWRTVINASSPGKIERPSRIGNLPLCTSGIHFRHGRKRS